MAQPQTRTPSDLLPSPRQTGGGGNLSLGGLYYALVDPPTGGLTILVSKPAAAAGAENATFTLTGPGAAGVSSLHAVRSVVVKSGDLDPDLSAYFVAQVGSGGGAGGGMERVAPHACARLSLQPDVAVVDGAFSLLVQPGDLWTVTTVATMTKGAVAAPPPPPAPFPTDPPYADDFEACPQFQGAWCALPSGGVTAGLTVSPSVAAPPEAPYFTDQVS